MATSAASVAVVLRQAPILSGLEPADLAALAETATLREIPRGGAVFAEGDEAKGFFICAAGKLKVFKSAADGREQILHFIFPGEKGFAGKQPIYDCDAIMSFALPEGGTDVRF